MKTIIIKTIGITFKGSLLPTGTYWYSIDYRDPETGKQIHEVNYFMIIN